MKRTVGVTRDFYISDYNMFKPSEVLSDIPEELAMNEKFVGKVRFIQILNLELAFRKYLILKQKLDTFSPMDAISYLEEIKAKQMDELNQILNKED